MNYLRTLWRNLWLAMRGFPGYVLVDEQEYFDMVARVARAERRAEGQRRSRAKRGPGTTDTTP